MKYLNYLGSLKNLGTLGLVIYIACERLTILNLQIKIVKQEKTTNMIVIIVIYWLPIQPLVLNRD